MELYFPTEIGERVAFVCAAAIALFGLLGFLFPAQALRLARFQVGEVRPEGYAATRAAGGHHVGLGLAAVMLAQDWIYLVLGVALAFAAIGRLVSAAFDRALTLQNIAFFLLQVALCSGLLSYVFGAV